MIVVDASAVVAALLHGGSARETLAEQQVHAPHLVDSEVASVLRRKSASGQISADDAWRMLRIWQRVSLTRYAIFPLLHRVWQLRDNVTSHDASYVALAEFLGCPLFTFDAKLAGAPGLRCSVSVLR